ncbi:MAG: 3-hydroxyacyl-CoA dehydrogenase [Gammaproteobacteria bacterium]|nr:3-hydroxyacyl-CoA dehydrogenase [Gammaproteobacteria bacterium]MBU1644938.1 3-hydroxyacyl-CoA dehydrogenase [Gammaproteobacteria bacterium]MBU1971397.1 3-hydroxyacyl-CoA dehydrogenase [Gammaproteobacteria bacterium]
MAALPPSTVVAVVGAGAMGAGIAQVAATAGHPVLLFDNRPGAAAQAIENLRSVYARLAAKGKLGGDAASAAAARLSAAAELADLAPAGLVIEAIVEDLDAKQGLFRQLETIVGADCLFASNTSSISITAIAGALQRPGRLAGLHFFNPAPLMALVEVISGLATTPAVATTLFDTAAAWGKTPVHAKSTPGFIVNRVARPYYGEALRLLGENAADCATIDAICREAGGFRMGPFELMDMIGLDVNYAVTRSVWNAYFNDPRFTPSLIQQELVAAGFLGRKSGRGFHDYRDGAVPPAPTFSAPCPLTANAVDIAICGESVAAAALAERLTAHGVAFTRRAAGDDRIAAADGVAIFVTDGRSATRRAADSALAATVVIDLALDYATAPRLAAAAALQCPQPQFDAAVGLLQAAGFVVSPVADAPGLVLMRAVAMLANEAADAVHQGVCTAAAADAAMRLGTNYPRGPLAWADAIGVAAVVTVLANLAEAYGEDRYRVSPFLRSRALAGRKCLA